MNATIHCHGTGGEDGEVGGDSGQIPLASMLLVAGMARGASARPPVRCTVVFGSPFPSCRHHEEMALAMTLAGISATLGRFHPGNWEGKLPQGWQRGAACRRGAAVIPDTAVIAVP